MLPLSDQISPKKPKPQFTSLKTYFSLHHHHRRRAWLLLAVVLLQIFLILAIYDINYSNYTASNYKPLPEGIHLNYSNYTASNPAGEPNFPAKIVPQLDNQTCPDGKIYIYELPKKFNADVLKNCHDLNPWGSRCHALENSGFGPPYAGISTLVPEKVAGAWYHTDQFTLELIFHDRMINYKCRTLDPESASAYYIPSNTGLAIEKYLFHSNSTAQARDQHCNEMLNWVKNKKYYKKSSGWDHFTTMGRITWDFRRSRNSDWGSSCIYLPEMRNITRLLIEKNPWDYFDIGVPYPTGFHPSSAGELAAWQDFVRTRVRKKMFCFAGATRVFFKDDFRGILLDQCRSESDTCRVVQCGGSKCANGSLEILDTFLDSDFCLQPRGDSFTRRSIFDCMVAGSIPVFFWKRTAYLQYEWFLPGEPESYSVFMDRVEVRNGSSIKKVLEKIGPDRVNKMREKVIELIPNIIYSNKIEGVEGIRDAFDVAVEGLMKRVKEQEGGYKWK